jgi:2-amino-4-hydroxy-6-hydroxymethyldihydropteridine diphosphokinase
VQQVFILIKGCLLAMNKIYLLLGSNMGSSRRQLADSIAHIKKSIGKVTRQSKLYSTAAWGNREQPDFLNQVVVAETILTAAETMQAILSIEKRMGRIRTVKNAPRVIDIDILFFNREIIRQKDLMVPHPEIQNRRFVLIPLNELSPGLVHPVLKKTTHQLLLNCTDTLDVKKF